jgi:hypothetical protein
MDTFGMCTNTHIAVAVLSGVIAFLIAYEMITQSQEKIVEFISGLRLGKPQVNGGQ